MNGLQRVNVATALTEARQEAPSEVIASPDGTQAVISWKGTPVTREWLTSYISSLVDARLVEPFPSIPADADPQTRGVLEAKVASLLAEWHKPLAGIPRETLTAAKGHFERYGVPQGRWWLRPSDVSAWCRPRLVRRIPPGHECPDHEGQRADTCRDCADRRRASVDPAFIAKLRDEMAKIQTPGREARTDAP